VLGPLKPTPIQTGLLIASILLFAAIVDAVAERYPLSDAHWDAAIYLLRARAFVESDVLGGFPTKEEAEAYGGQLVAHWKAGGDVWHCANR